MKKLFFLNYVMFFALIVNAQDIQDESKNANNSLGTLAKGLYHHLSFSVTGGTPSLSLDALKAASFKEIGNVSIGELNLSYRINNQFSVGVSWMAALGNCNSGYYTEGNQFVAFVADENDDHKDGHHDGDDDEIDEEDDGCDDELGNVMGTVTFKFPEGVPFFVQAAGGYSLNYNAPAYSAMVGYYHKIVAGLGIVGGVRFSDVLHQLPADGVRLATTSGIKAEIGLNWNF